MSVQSSMPPSSRYNLRSKNNPNSRKVYYESDLSSDSDNSESESDMEFSENDEIKRMNPSTYLSIRYTR